MNTWALRSRKPQCWLPQVWWRLSCGSRHGGLPLSTFESSFLQEGQIRSALALVSAFVCFLNSFFGGGIFVACFTPKLFRLPSQMCRKFICAIPRSVAVAVVREKEEGSEDAQYGSRVTPTPVVPHSPEKKIEMDTICPMLHLILTLQYWELTVNGHIWCLFDITLSQAIC